MRWPAQSCPSTFTSSGRRKPLAMADFEVHIDRDGRTRPIGLARSNRVRGTETILFEYDGAWLDDPDRFSLEPALALTRGRFTHPAGLDRKSTRLNSSHSSAYRMLSSA